MNLKIAILSCICFLSFEAVAQRVTLPRIQRADGPGYIPYTDANGKQTYQLLDTLVTGNDIGSGLDSMVAVWRNDTLTNGIIYDDSTHVGIGVTSGLDGIFTVKSNLSGSNDEVMTVSNNSGTPLFRIINGRGIVLGGNSVTTSPSIRIFDTNPFSQAPTNGRGIVLNHWRLSTDAKTGIALIGPDMSIAVSGETSHVDLDWGFKPTAGTHAYNGMSLSGEINQTGTADGITRGIYVKPTLTAAGSWRSFETNVASGYGFLSSGAALNILAGNTKVGTSGDPVRDLEVDGELRVTADVDTAEQELIWAGNNEGDLNRLIVGEGLSVSGDSLIGEGVTYTAGTNIVIAGDSISADIKWPHWDGGVTWAGSGLQQNLTTAIDTCQWRNSVGTMSMEVHISELISFDSLGWSSFPGWIFDESGTYQVSYQFIENGDNSASSRRINMEWYINGEGFDPFGNGYIRIYYNETADRSPVSHSFQIDVGAGQMLQMGAKLNTGTSDMRLENFRLQIQKIRD